MPTVQLRKTVTARLEDIMSKYDDIIDREYRGSTSSKKMTMAARAAQFAPFAALTGHNAAINETARLTSEKLELSRDEQLIISDRLNLVLSLIKEQPVLSIKYFTPDNIKKGGSYVSVKGYIVKFLEYDNVLLLSDGSSVNIKDIMSIEGGIFE